jgi:SRSO17 transposase
MTITYRQDPVSSALKDLLPLDFKLARQNELEPLWDELVRNYHYLGHGKMPGAHLKYLVLKGDIPLAALSFRAASIKLNPRDSYIGWSVEQRRKHLSELANNNRFLILPWVRVKNLGSYLLSQVTAPLLRDWSYYYQRKLMLLETFVDPRYFQGTVYQAAGWHHVGKTLGYTRQGAEYIYHGHPKEVYLYPLQKDFRAIIGCSRRPFIQRKPSFPQNPPERSEILMLLNRIDWNPALVAELSLESKDVERLTALLLDFCEQYRSCFVRRDQFLHALSYIKGLTADGLVKTIETIAIAILGVQRVRSLQYFFTGSNWEAEKLTARNRDLLSQRIADADGMFTLDSSEILKKGKDSAGVAPQYCGSEGKVANCQSGVFLGYCSEKGYGLLEQQLYVPELWFTPEYEERRQKTRFPAGLKFKTKLEIALDLLANSEASSTFQEQWVGMDSTFGADSSFRDAVGSKYYYLAGIRSNTLLWIKRPEFSYPPYKGRGPHPKKKRPTVLPQPVSKIAADPALRWEPVNLGEGAKGPIICWFARLCVIEHRDGLPGKELWLLLRRNSDGEVKAMLSNAPADMPLKEMLRFAQMRWTIEQLFQEGKDFLGLDEYEMRSYPGWHRHMALVNVTMHFLLTVRLEFGLKKTISPCPLPKN